MKRSGYHGDGVNSNVTFKGLINDEGGGSRHFLGVPGVSLPGEYESGGHF